MILRSASHHKNEPWFSGWCNLYLRRYLYVVYIILLQLAMASDIKRRIAVDGKWPSSRENIYSFPNMSFQLQTHQLNDSRTDRLQSCR